MKHAIASAMVAPTGYCTWFAIVNLTLVFCVLPPPVAVTAIAYTPGGVVLLVRTVNSLEAPSDVGVREGGLKVLVTPAGSPAAVNATGWEKAPEAVATMV
jgi:hypothetical protein